MSREYQRGYSAGYYAGLRKREEREAPQTLDDVPTCPVCRYEGEGAHRCVTGWVTAASPLTIESATEERD